jgi:hypothetical protein
MLGTWFISLGHVSWSSQKFSGLTDWNTIVIIILSLRGCEINGGTDLVHWGCCYEAAHQRGEEKKRGSWVAARKFIAK